MDSDLLGYLKIYQVIDSHYDGDEKCAELNARTMIIRQFVGVWIIFVDAGWPKKRMIIVRMNDGQ